MESLVFSRLTGDAGVTDLVGQRVYPLRLPQEPTYPAIMYQRVSTNEAHTHDQAGGLAESRVQFDCLAVTYSQAQALAAAVRAALNGWVDDGNGILACLLENQIDLYEDTTESYRVVLDFMLKWR